MRLFPQVWGLAAVFLDSWVSVVVLVLVVSWLLAGLTAARRGRGAGIDWALAGTAGLAGLIYLVGPDEYMSTIHFGWRWVPCALTWLVLALPVPELPSRVGIGVATATTGAVIVVTAVLWSRFESRELTGLEQAIEAVPEGARVLGLDFVKQSESLIGKPFLQTASWAAALRGADSDFSFAEHGHGIVRFRERRYVPWNRGPFLDADSIRLEDYRYFDFALVHLPIRSHGQFESEAPVQPVTAEGRWRLYRVTNSTACDVRVGTAQRACLTTPAESSSQDHELPGG
jgi:hypothetical protein